MMPFPERMPRAPLVPVYEADPKFLSFIAFWVVGFHLLDIYVIILPFLHPAGFQIRVLNVLCLFGMGCPLAFSSCLPRAEFRSFQRETRSA